MARQRRAISVEPRVDERASRLAAEQFLEGEEKVVHVAAANRQTLIATNMRLFIVKRASLPGTTVGQRVEGFGHAEIAGIEFQIHATQGYIRVRLRGERDAAKTREPYMIPVDRPFEAPNAWVASLRAALSMGLPPAPPVAPAHAGDAEADPDPDGLGTEE